MDRCPRPIACEKCEARFYTWDAYRMWRRRSNCCKRMVKAVPSRASYWEGGNDGAKRLRYRAHPSPLLALAISVGMDQCLGCGCLKEDQALCRDDCHTKEEKRP